MAENIVDKLGRMFDRQETANQERQKEMRVFMMRIEHTVNRIDNKVNETDTKVKSIETKVIENSKIMKEMTARKAVPDSGEDDSKKTRPNQTADNKL